MDRNLRYYNRELSWLNFNYRVLQEAKDPSVPLLERLKFLAIYASNLDEYFRVRVATIKRLKHLKKKTRRKLKDDPGLVHDQILKEVDRQQTEFGDIYRNQLLPGLRERGIFLINEKEVTPEQGKFLNKYFEDEVRPVISPISLHNSPERLFLKDGICYLGITLSRQGIGTDCEYDYHLLELPVKALGRFVRLPDQDGQHYVIMLDDVIRYCLPRLFPGYLHYKANEVKLSRDAELDIEDDVPGSLLEKIRKSVRKRAEGHPARLLYDPHIPQPLLDLLQELIGVSYDELVAGSRYHNFRDFFSFPKFEGEGLTYPPRPPLSQPVLEKSKDLFRTISEGDQLAHYPYQKFDYALKLLNQAAADPKVTAISITLYRVADKSEVGKALVKAAKNGKRVTAVIELKARFDEESNINWATKLEKAGATVIYGIPDHKVHTKLMLIQREEPDEPKKLYAYLSTGNFNEVTSHIYADHALFTVDPRLTREVQEIFNFFIDQKFSRRFMHLAVAPFNMRRKFYELIDKEIAAAKEGKPAYMILKMNALEDERMTEKLYEASQAGVKIQMLVRGICILKPGVPGLSENITVTAIIDRYLEHARVYIFGNGGREKMYIASADWMTRNLSRRIEVAFPVYDKDCFAQVRQIIDLQLQDNQKARNAFNEYVGAADETQPSVRAQMATFDLLETYHTKTKAATKRAKPKPRRKPATAKS